MKYIDADKLKKIVEQAKQRALKGVEVDEDMYCDGRADAFGDVLLEIDSLQQEQPDVDLEKEINSEWAKCNPIDEGMGSEYVNISIEQFDALSHHFFELGQQEIRHRIMNPEYNAKVVERLKSEYPTIKIKEE